MAGFVARQDNFEFQGTVVFVSPPLDVSAAVLLWSVVVKPAPGHEAAATSSDGNVNPGGTVTCAVAVRQTLATWGDMLQMLGAATGQRCDGP